MRKFEVELQINKSSTAKGRVELTGVLTREEDEISFDPLLVIGDFIEMTQKVPLEPFSYSNHPFTKIACDWWGDSLFQDDLEKACRLNIMLRKSGIFLKRLSHHSINTFKAELKNHKINLPECRYTFLDGEGLYHSNVWPEDFLTVAQTDYRYEYTCHSISQIFCCVWAFYLEQGYHLGECAYCGFLFARKTDKEIYCPRVMAFDNQFTRKEGASRSCKEASKYIWRCIRDYHRYIDDKMRKSERDEDVLFDYRKEYDAYHKELKAQFSHDIYKQFAAFLVSAKKQKKWRKSPPT